MRESRQSCFLGNQSFFGASFRGRLYMKSEAMLRLPRFSLSHMFLGKHHIEDNDLELLSCEIQGLKKIVTFGSVSTPQFCPKCSYKMYSRGIKTRTINHPVLQDGYQLVMQL